eukprot:scaffold38617_cov44-Prasinocladus_malaysianus.AAC.1
MGRCVGPQGRAADCGLVAGEPYHRGARGPRRRQGVGLYATQAAAGRPLHPHDPGANFDSHLLDAFLPTNTLTANAARNRPSLSLYILYGDHIV